VLRDPALEKDLPDDARQDLDYWRGLLEPLLGEKHGIKAGLRRIATMSGQSTKTVSNRFYAARKQGLSAWWTSAWPAGFWAVKPSEIRR